MTSCLVPSASAKGSPTPHPWAWLAGKAKHNTPAEEASGEQASEDANGTTVGTPRSQMGPVIELQ
eukprot:15437730-Alexandrium_andersonii.AAC.1